MQFLLKGNLIQIHKVFPFLTFQYHLFQNSSDPDVTPNLTFFITFVVNMKF